MYPQGACRIRKAAKPPTAAQYFKIFKPISWGERPAERRSRFIQRFPKYQLRYTRLLEQDLMRAAQYIDQVLDNPTAAQKLVDDTEKAILERLNFAESFEPYPSTKQREYPYYRIYVHNCTVFYVVIDGVMEVRRFLYSAQDIPRML